MENFDVTSGFKMALDAMTDVEKMLSG